MIAWKLKGWSAAGVAAAALSVAACGSESDHAAAPAGDKSGADRANAGDEGAAPAASVGEGGESGEAGAVSAYAGLSGDQLTALRIQHLRGFVMAAAAVNAQNKPAEAAVLVQQGLLEVYDAAPDQFGDLNIAIIRTAADGAANRTQMTQHLRASEAEFDRVFGALDADHAVLTARMVDIATGLYQNVNQADFVDSIEYQHSMGAALAARAALNAETLQRRNPSAYRDAERELSRFVALWPQASAPEHPAPYREVLAQSSRVRLALSPFL
jgi:hypothetical protein